MTFKPGPAGFFAFAALVGLDLEPFQRRIVRAVYGDETELLVLLPRGNGKTTLLGAVAVHALLTQDRPRVYCAAASAAHARICFEAARDFCAHPHVAQHVVIRALEIRRADGTGHLRLLPSDGPRTMGLDPSFAICDELHAHRDGALYESLRSSMVKRPDSRMVTISTADVGPERPLSRLRARALAAPVVKRAGMLTDCSGNGLRALLWEVDDDADLDDLAAAVKVNPASWITRAALEGQHAALPTPAWARLHLNARVSPEGSWLPAGAFQRCVGTPIFTPGENVWIGVDVGSTASATAVCYLNEALHVGVEIFHGEEGILRAIDAVHDLAGRYQIVECAGDPWRWGQAGLELRARGINATDFPQTDVRMVPASQALRDAITERRLVLPADRELAEHASNAVQRQGRRGWRIDKPSREANIDAVIALCIALQRAENRPAPLRVLWAG